MLFLKGKASQANDFHEEIQRNFMRKKCKKIPFLVIETLSLRFSELFIGTGKKVKAAYFDTFAGKQEKFYLFTGGA